MDNIKKFEDFLGKMQGLLDNAKKQGHIIIRVEDLEKAFPELKESEDEKIRKELITHCRNTRCVTEEGAERIAKWIDWLEKQGEHSIYNVPSREVILAIWDLGNEWKELTNGSISTEYGTQLDYIQKHWHESEYYLKEKQGEQKPQRMISAEAKEALLSESGREALRTEYEKCRADAIAEIQKKWSEEDDKMCQETIDWFEKKCFPYAIGEENPAKDSINWLKSIKQKIKGE